MFDSDVKFAVGSITQVSIKNLPFWTLLMFRSLIVIAKMRMYIISKTRPLETWAGLSGTVREWFRSYLEERSYFVTIGSYESDRVAMTWSSSGVSS